MMPWMQFSQQYIVQPLLDYNYLNRPWGGSFAPEAVATSEIEVKKDPVQPSRHRRTEVCSSRSVILFLFFFALIKNLFFFFLKKR